MSIRRRKSPGWREMLKGSSVRHTPRIRSRITKARSRTPKKSSQPKTRTRQHPEEVLGNIFGFLPPKTLVKVVKTKSKFSDYALRHRSFDMSDVKVCRAFTHKDFDLLIQNQKLDRNGLLVCALNRNLVKMVEILIKDPKVDPGTNNNAAIRWASKKGYLKIVKELLEDERVDPGDYYNYAISLASAEGHLKVVRMLLKDTRVDPSSNDNWTIRVTMERGWPENKTLLVVKELLKWKGPNGEKIDPSVDNNYPMRTAKRRDYMKIADELLKDPRVDPNAEDEIYFDDY